MPTNRKRTSRGRRGAPIDADESAILNDETPVNPFIALVRPDSHWRELWAQYGDEITQKWAQKYPGTRPKHWWKFSAPPEDEQENDSESERAFLKRHGLLLPGEASRCR